MSDAIELHRVQTARWPCIQCKCFEARRRCRNCDGYEGPIVLDRIPAAACRNMHPVLLPTDAQMQALSIRPARPQLEAALLSVGAVLPCK